MRRRPERVLLFRSGRHLQTALAALAADSPGCEVTVVATSAAVSLLDQIGVDPRRRILYDRTPFFHPGPFMRSRAWLRAVGGRFDRVCVLWNDPDGSGQSNVDRTALAVHPSGFTAITADGALHALPSGPLLAREARRAVLSMGVRLALTVGVFVPARIARLAGAGSGRSASPRSGVRPC